MYVIFFSIPLSAIQSKSTQFSLSPFSGAALSGPACLLSLHAHFFCFRVSMRIKGSAISRPEHGHGMELTGILSNPCLLAIILHAAICPFSITLYIQLRTHMHIPTSKFQCEKMSMIQECLKVLEAGTLQRVRWLVRGKRREQTIDGWSKRGRERDREPYLPTPTNHCHDMDHLDRCTITTHIANRRE
jgi:hypothetical protein